MAQTMIRLRDYQREGIDAVFKAHEEGIRRPALVMATGLGKTVLFAHLVKEFTERTGLRALILVHRDELADQALNKIRSIAPELEIGKVKAVDDQVGAQVMVGSVQTLARKERALRLLDAQTYAGNIGLVIVDECHHAAATSYRNLLASLSCFDPDSPVRALGVTATLARGDGRGLGDIWEEVVFTRSTLWGISQGYLTDVRARQIDLEDLDLKSVKKSGGDYSAKSLGEALMDADAPRVVQQVLSQHAADRRSIIVFTPTVAVAEAISAGLPDSAVVQAATPREERLHIYEQFRTGRLRSIINCAVLTEGFDAPHTDCIVVARPTQSEVLFQQMVGRGLRPSPQTGKSDALVLILSGSGGSIRTLIDLEPDVVVPVKDGESLAEAYERQEQIREEMEDKRARREKANPLRFQLKHKDLDLFKASPAYQWLRTAKGVQFVPLGSNGLILLWPCADTEGLWDVVWVPEGREPWQRLHTCLDLGMAMAWGESEADARSTLNTGKAASWRKKPASEAQIRYAGQLRQTVEPGMRAGDVGDLISIALASRKVDRFAKAI